jgi:UDP-N-acetylglucosamine:LPS N-acetylglucosamine transferase
MKSLPRPTQKLLWPIVRTRVLVISASMGAGHDGAGRELVSRLQAVGHDAEMRDFVRAAPLHLGRFIRSAYEFQMRHMAWTYDLTYRLWYLLPFLCPPLAQALAWATGRNVQRWAADYRADLIVSTYPLSSTVLGQLRGKGKLDIPVVNFITDFGVHPLWVHPRMDLNLAVHPRPALDAATRSGRPAIATGPMVSPRFRLPQDRMATRASLGLDPSDRAVLIVAGSWGVGAVAKTFRTIAESGRYVPVAVCGRDERLRRKLEQVPGGRALGWRDDMPALMAAADALVENAGGLTSMEALSVGLPIVSFKPIAGHGKENTSEMDGAGVSRLAKSPGHLLDLLELVTSPGPARTAMTEAGQAMFASDPVDHVLDLAASAEFPDTLDLPDTLDPSDTLDALDVPESDQLDPTDLRPDTAELPEGAEPVAPSGPRRPSVLVARIAAAVAAVPLLWAALTTGVGVVTAYGAGVARPPSHVGAVAFIGVRLDGTQLVDTGIQHQLASLGATAVIDRSTAELFPEAVQQLVDLNVDVESGGAGTQLDDSGHRVSLTPWDRAHLDLQSCALLTRIAGQPVKVFVPGRRLNAFDLVASYTAHSRTVVPDEIVTPEDADEPLHLAARHIYLVNGERATPAELSELLPMIAAQLRVAGLSGAPLVDLR